MACRASVGESLRWLSELEVRREWEEIGEVGDRALCRLRLVTEPGVGDLYPDGVVEPLPVWSAPRCKPCLCSYARRSVSVIWSTSGTMISGSGEIGNGCAAGDLAISSVDRDWTEGVFFASMTRGSKDSMDVLSRMEGRRCFTLLECRTPEKMADTRLRSPFGELTFRVDGSGPAAESIGEWSDENVGDSVFSLVKCVGL